MYNPYQIIKKIKGKEINDDFAKICKMNVKKLTQYLIKQLSKYYKTFYTFEDKYIYCKGSDLILTAHLDTVHKETCDKVYENKENNKNYYYAPKGIGGDDRCGIYIILKLVEQLKTPPTIIFFNYEETGGIGSSAFAKIQKELKGKYILEIDRKGTGIVFYEEANKDFEKDILKITGRQKEWGSFSDICNLYKYKIASCNLGCGYYNAHTLDEYVCKEEMEQTIEDIIKINNKMTKKYLHKKQKKVAYDYGSYLTNFRDNDWYELYNIKKDLYK